jgi:hypothetical protein
VRVHIDRAWRQLGQRERKTALLGLLVVGPILLFRGGIDPYLDARSRTREGLTRERALFQRELQLITDSQGFPELARSAERSLSTEAARLFTGPNAVAMTAELGTYVEAEAAQHQVLIEEVGRRENEPDPVISIPAADRIQVDVTGRADLQGFLELLAALEGGPKLIHIEEILVERAENDLSALTREAPGDSTITDGIAAHPAILDFSLAVVAFAMSTGPADSLAPVTPPAATAIRPTGGVVR